MAPNDFPKHMIGVATKQNTINVIPALQFQINTFTFVETEYAKNQKWIEGSIKVFQNKKISCTDSIMINNDDNANINIIIGKIKDFLKLFLEDKIDNGFIFNIGGGQKAQSIALWQIFYNRKNEKDIAVYTDQSTKKNEVLQWNNKAIVCDNIPIDVNLVLDEILTVYNVEITLPKNIQEHLFYSNDDCKTASIHEEIDYYKYAEFREYIAKCFKHTKLINEQLELDNTPYTPKYTLEDIQTIFKGDANKEILKHLENKLKANKINTYKELSGNLISFNKNQLIDIVNTITKYTNTTLLRKLDSTDTFTFKEKTLIDLAVKNCGNKSIEINSDLIKDLIGGIGKNGDYFEKLVVFRIKEILEKEDHIVTKAYFDISVQQKENKAQFDVVLVTKYGTIQVIEVKSAFKFTRKEEDASIYKLLNAAGIYSAHNTLYLLFVEDINKPYLTTSFEEIFKAADEFGRTTITYNYETDAKKTFKINNKIYNLNPISGFLEHLKLKK